ncbi:hypothetical protein EJB05_40518, partial [Eragrostis curvula]
MSAYAGAGDAREVSRLMSSMRIDECKPSAVTLTVGPLGWTMLVRLFEQSPRREAVSWNIIISEYSAEGNVPKVVEMYERMRREEVYPTCETLTAVVAAFTQSRSLQQDVQGIQGKSSCIWSAMIWACFHHGRFLDVINVFGQMMELSLVPTTDVLQGVILSYTELGALRFGKATHGYIIRNSKTAELDSSALETSIVKLYARCGNIHLAERMLEEGVRPNPVTFLSLLSACSHSGLVSEARELFDCMRRKFGISPELGHYTCMVDVLGRSGNLQEAVQVIRDMKVMPDSRIWGALLASCRTHSDSKLADFAAQKLMELEPDNVGYHVVLSNVQAGGGKWGNVEDIRRSMVEAKMLKCPAWSCVPEMGSPLICED